MSSFKGEFKHLMIPLEIIRDATNNFGEDNFIAEGGYGKVYRGEFLRSEGRTMGAVKRWSLTNGEGDPEFRREIMLLSDNKHENLILLLGFCHENNERILVYEYAPNKSLDFHLENPKFTWIQRLKVCLGAARGLEYLHNPRGDQRVLHCDIKSANILLDEKWNAKIADFGLSKYGPATKDRSYLITQAKGTQGYADPAFLETMIYTKESDVYSFGVVLFEVLCSRFCFDLKYNDRRRSLLVLAKNSSKEEILDKLVSVNLRPQMEENSFYTFITVAQQCLNKEQKERPSMDLIVKEIETALEYQERTNVISGDVNLASSSTPYAEKEKHGVLAQNEQSGRNQLWGNPDEDDMIKRWSSGKEGNLRALLSTLHDILGPESGWKQISLTERTKRPLLMRDYNNAAFLVGPDKLKERAASESEKYKCGKVLEILQEGLVRFNYEQREIQERKDSEERHQRRILGEIYDDDIKRWSSGKEEDLRELLSTLQDILGPKSGWKPVSLTEDSGVQTIIEPYLKSLLLTDPANLNKRRAGMHERYIYGKVHKILEDAWNIMLTC